MSSRTVRTIVGAKLDECPNCGRIGAHLLRSIKEWRLLLGFIPIPRDATHSLVCGHCAFAVTLGHDLVATALKSGSLPLDRPRPSLSEFATREAASRITPASATPPPKTYFEAQGEEALVASRVNRWVTQRALGHDGLTVLTDPLVAKPGPAADRGYERGWRALLGIGVSVAIAAAVSVALLFMNQPQEAGISHAIARPTLTPGPASTPRSVPTSRPTPSPRPTVDHPGSSALLDEIAIYLRRHVPDELTCDPLSKGSAEQKGPHAAVAWRCQLRVTADTGAAADESPLVYYMAFRTAADLRRWFEDITKQATGEPKVSAEACWDDGPPGISSWVSDDANGLRLDEGDIACFVDSDRALSNRRRPVLAWTHEPFLVGILMLGSGGGFEDLMARFRLGADLKR